MAFFTPTLSRLARLALLILVLGSTTGAWAATAPNRFGIYFIGAKHVQIGQALGVSYERQDIPVNPPNGGEAVIIARLRAAGFGVLVSFKNRCNPPPHSCPVTDPAAYKTSLATQIDATLPTLVIIENEEDGTIFSTATPTQYLQELTYAVQVAHAKGYRITNGGITGLGLSLATWSHLWRTGPCAVADAFARAAFDRSLIKGRIIVGRIPDCANPARPILAKSADLQLLLQSAEALIAGYRATGIDYVNFHWYEADPLVMGQAVGYLEQATGLPAVAGEMGQFSFSAETVVGLLAESIALKLPYVMWFASDGMHSLGLANQAGVLRPNGLAFRNYLVLHK